MSLSVKPGRELVKRLVLAEVLAKRGEGPLSLRAQSFRAQPRAPGGSPSPVPQAPPAAPVAGSDWSELSREFAERKP